jgi:alpha-tubulin suppressor-like RCC1 family protein
MNRRQALTLLGGVPLAAQAFAQTATRPHANTRISFGAGHALLLEPDGTVKTWLTDERSDGRAPDFAGLGHNDPLAAYTLTAVPNLTNIVKVRAGNGCSFAIRADGQVLAWGWNSGQGLLGTTTLEVVETTVSWAPSSNKAIPTLANLDVIDISTINTHALALTRDGHVYAWGAGLNGRLGIGPLPVINFKNRTPGAMAYVPFPVRIPELSNVVAINAGGSHSLALLKDGTVYAWGDNRSGQLGDGTTTDRDRPVLVPGVREAVGITSGGGFSLALLADGTVMQWGPRAYVESPIQRPTLVPGARGLKTIAAGSGFVAGITTDNTVMTWGNNGVYQLGRGRNAPNTPGVVGNGVTDVQSIEAYGITGVAVLGAGRIMTWGGVRNWTRPDGGDRTLSPNPILLWVDGLEQSWRS